MTTKLDYSLDQIDYQILRIMQENARTNNADIARELGMAPSAILERVKKLEQKEVILQYNAKINQNAVDQKLLSFIFIDAQNSIDTQKVGLLLANIPDLLVVIDITGDDCYLIMVHTNDAMGLVEHMRITLGKIEEIISTLASIVLKSVE